MGGDPFGLASEATLHGWRPLRPRKRGNAPRVATPSASQARQHSTGLPDVSKKRLNAFLHLAHHGGARTQAFNTSKLT